MVVSVRRRPRSPLLHQVLPELAFPRVRPDRRRLVFRQEPRKRRRLLLQRKHLYPFHRLDRATSGVLLFGLSRDAAAALQRSLASADAHKEYVKNHLGPNGKTTPLHERVIAIEDTITSPALRK